MRKHFLPSFISFVSCLFVAAALMLTPLGTMAVAYFGGPFLILCMVLGIQSVVHIVYGAVALVIAFLLWSLVSLVLWVMNSNRVQPSNSGA